MKRLLPLLLVAATGCGTPLTNGHVQASFATTFTGLYVQQQRLLGRNVDRNALHVVSSCRRTGKTGAGPGEDWACAAQLSDAGTAVAQVFEVQVKADGCWTATGSTAAQPADVVDPVTLQRTTNPLAEFDGCLDTSWR